LISHFKYSYFLVVFRRVWYTANRTVTSTKAPDKTNLNVYSKSDIGDRHSGQKALKLERSAKTDI